MRIAFVGGASGGHFYPLMAVAEELHRMDGDNTDMYYFGPSPYNKDELEQNLNFT